MLFQLGWRAGPSGLAHFAIPNYYNKEFFQNKKSTAPVLILHRKGQFLFPFFKYL